MHFEFGSLVLLFFLIYGANTTKVNGADEVTSKELYNLLEKRGATLDEWGEDEAAHLNAIKQLENKMKETPRQSIKMGEMVSHKRIDVSKLVASGIELASHDYKKHTKKNKVEKKTDNDDSNHEKPQKLKEKPVVASKPKKVHEDSDSSGDGGTSVGLILIAVFPGVVALVVIATMLVLCVASICRYRKRRVHERRKQAALRGVPRYVVAPSRQGMPRPSLLGGGRPRPIYVPAYT